MADIDPKSRKVSLSQKKRSAKGGKGKNKDSKYGDVSVCKWQTLTPAWMVIE